MQITGSRGLPEPGGSRGSTDRKAYKAVSLSLLVSSSPPPPLSHPLLLVLAVVSPSAHARALAPATVTAPYISRGSGGGAAAQESRPQI